MNNFLIFGTILLVLLIIFVIKIVFMNQDELAEYSKKVAFGKGKALHFPDFDLKFIGQRQQPPVGSLHLAPVYRFEVISQGPKRTVEWSAGTGDFGPSDFTVSGQVFLLEMKNSLILGKLDENILVVRKAE